MQGKLEAALVAQKRAERRAGFVERKLEGKTKELEDKTRGFEEKTQKMEQELADQKQGFEEALALSKRDLDRSNQTVVTRDNMISGLKTQLQEEQTQNNEYLKTIAALELELAAMKEAKERSAGGAEEPELAEGYGLAPLQGGDYRDKVTSKPSSKNLTR